MNDPMNDLAAAFDNHQVTDDNGEIVAEETAQEETAPQEQTPAEEPATAEKSADDTKSPKTEEASENEPEMVETAADETGKRYVPEARFKEVYAKWKEAERKSKERGEPNREPMPVRQPPQPINKTDAIEVELLRTTLPQFNPESPEYSKDIDELGFSIYEGSKDTKGNYTITRLEAARKALNMAKKITSKVAEIKLEARTVKAQQSDQGITNRVLNREGAKLDPNKMSLEEKEEWLKANNQW
jgi:hypothetical protein